MDLRGWLTMLRRYWRSTAALTLVGALLGVVATVAVDKTWTSSSQLLFTPAGAVSEPARQASARAGQRG